MKLRVLLLALLAFTTVRAEPFRDGDRWTAVGDSITHSGTYHAWICLFYATRFPTLKLSLDNAGISGDSARGALQRYPWDIQPRKATVATVMLGMNDVSRSLYDGENPGPEILAKRETALETYRKNLSLLTKQLQSDGTRVVLMTPSPFDETAESDRPRQTGVNGALSQCADFMKNLAQETGATVLDLHGPLNELNGKLQASNPKASIVGADRIHPAPPGHFAMAYFFLKAQGAEGPVSEVEIDAASGKLIKAENAEVSGLKSGTNGIEFQCSEKALPYPIPDEVRPALEWVPFQEEFNQEILRVTGLPEKPHTLFIDGQRIAELPAEKLSGGVNLAEFKNTPQYQQASKVLDLVKKRQALAASGDRGIAYVENAFLSDLPRPISFDTAKEKLEARLAKLDEKKDAYNIGSIKRYFVAKPNEAQTRTELAELADAIYAAAQPVSHTYSLVP